MQQRADHPWRTKGYDGPPLKMRYAREIRTERLREAFERSGLSKVELARRLGWVTPNIDKLNRALGYRPDYTRGVKRSIPRQTVSYELAVLICRAMDASPVDVGI